MTERVCAGLVFSRVGMRTWLVNATIQTLSFIKLCFMNASARSGTRVIEVGQRRTHLGRQSRQQTRASYDVLYFLEMVPE
jgi:hypothetical protein